MTERRKADRRSLSQDILMSDSQVGRLAGVSPKTVKHWRLIGILSFVKVGKHPRVWLSEFQKLFQKPLSPWTQGAGKMPSAGDGGRCL